MCIHGTDIGGIILCMVFEGRVGALWSLIHGMDSLVLTYCGFVGFHNWLENCILQNDAFIELRFSGDVPCQ